MQTYSLLAHQPLTGQTKTANQIEFEKLKILEKQHLNALKYTQQALEDLTKLEATERLQKNIAKHKSIVGSEKVQQAITKHDDTIDKLADITRDLSKLQDGLLNVELQLLKLQKEIKEDTCQSKQFANIRKLYS